VQPLSQDLIFGELFGQEICQAYSEIDKLCFLLGFNSNELPISTKVHQCSLT